MVNCHLDENPGRESHTVHSHGVAVEVLGEEEHTVDREHSLGEEGRDSAVVGHEQVVLVVVHEHRTALAAAAVHFRRGDQIGRL